MPQNITITVPAGVWTQLTDANISAARVQNYGSSPVFVMATVGAVAPTTHSGAIALDVGQGFAADLTLAQLFPGVVGGNRLYAYSDAANPVSISHV